MIVFRAMRTKGLGLVSLVILVGAWLSPACGSSDSEESGGTGGKKDSGTEASTGGSAGTPTADAGPDTTLACNPADCQGFQGIVPGCCLPDDTCGYDGTQLGVGCVSPNDIAGLLEGGLTTPDGAADPNCDGFQIGGFNLSGCCLPTGFCGIYVPFLNQCADPANPPSPIPPFDAGTPKACGDGGTSTSDAGVDAASDAAAD